MHHHHTIPHTHEHPICVATIIYNIIVLIAEVGILFAFTHTDAHELAAYEWTLQIIHLLGTALLGVLTWYLTHRLSHHATKPGQSQLSTNLQTTAGFFSISTLMLIAHIILLHVVPRLIGFSLHEHDEHQSEIMEYAILAAIIVFVTIAFRYRDTMLQKLGWKNRITIPQPMFLRRWSQRLTHQHHVHHHHHHTTHE